MGQWLWTLKYGIKPFGYPMACLYRQLPVLGLANQIWIKSRSAWEGREARYLVNRSGTWYRSKIKRRVIFHKNLKVSFGNIVLKKNPLIPLPRNLWIFSKLLWYLLQNLNKHFACLCFFSLSNSPGYHATRILDHRKLAIRQTVGNTKVITQFKFWCLLVKLNYFYFLVWICI